ncbi:MAG: sialidase family protein [Eudoraea sp.]|nr:sialidase family protein [Eudoraea sp.]
MIRKAAILIIITIISFSCTRIPNPEPIDVFIAGEEAISGHNNKPYSQYREQNVIITNSGAIVVVVQGRNKSKWSDRSGQDLWCKISRDNGETWGDPIFVAGHGLKSICPNAAVYDSGTNTIHVLYNLFLWDYTDVPEDVKGELGDLYCKQYMVSSEDEGNSWSQPREITKMVDTKGAVMVVGSGEGIQLKTGEHKGRLIIAGGDFYQGKKVLCYYSDDHGITWKRSEIVPWEGEMAWASESKVAELSDGTLILNSRTFVNNGSEQRLRTRSFSNDGGISWSTLENDPDLMTVSCNGSIIAIQNPEDGQKSILLCSVPVGPGRTHGTIYVSHDNGQTWPHKKLVVEGQFAYSSLAELPDGTIGLFYETDAHMNIRLLKLNLEQILN